MRKEHHKLSRSEASQSRVLPIKTQTQAFFSFLFFLDPWLLDTNIIDAREFPSSFLSQGPGCLRVEFRGTLLWSETSCFLLNSLMKTSAVLSVRVHQVQCSWTALGRSPAPYFRYFEYEATGRPEEPEGQHRGDQPWAIWVQDTDAGFDCEQSCM